MSAMAGRLAVAVANEERREAALVDIAAAGELTATTRVRG
jgi:hypothetical protein